MKRFIGVLGVTVLAVAVTAASALAGPPPKATGDFGYAFGGVQRHISFSATQSSTDTTSGVFSNVGAVNSINFKVDGDPANGTYVHNVALTQNLQSVTGTGSYATGLDYANTSHVTSGSVVGNKLDLTWVYDTGQAGIPGLTYHMIGTIASNGSISGTWSDNYLGSPRTGTFTASGATSIPYSGKGTFSYNDASGNWYFGVVKTVSVQSSDAWYSAEIIAGNLGFESLLTNNMFFKVSDVAEPGIAQDVVSFNAGLGTAADAASAVNSRTTPNLSAFINQGNIQVH
jgi:hypothetical protein